MLLYIDGAVRTNSRTRELADFLADKKNCEKEYVRLAQENISALDEKTLLIRDEACRKGDFSNPYFKYARQFAKADEIIMVAPFWDLSFPSLVKAYFENICVTGLTFRYSDNGVPVGMCRAKRLYYVTTAGGTIFNDEFGYGYVRALAQGLFGIGEVVLIKAENLDIVGSDVSKIMSDAKKLIDEILKKE
ncbi:MAG: NAD(P)H-dependent oxidoreductase [Ruminococcus sp.]